MITQSADSFQCGLVGIVYSAPPPPPPPPTQLASSYSKLSTHCSNEWLVVLMVHHKLLLPPRSSHPLSICLLSHVTLLSKLCTWGAAVHVQSIAC